MCERVVLFKLPLQLQSSSWASREEGEVPGSLWSVGSCDVMLPSECKSSVCGFGFFSAV